MYIPIMMLILFALFPLYALRPGTVAAQPAQLTPQEGRASHAGVTPPLRSLRPPPQAVTPIEIGQEREIPLLPFRPALGPKQRSVAPLSLDATPAAAPAASMPSPTITFDGLSNADNVSIHGVAILPADPNGDVGPDHYVQSVNLLFRVFSKNGAPLTPPLKMSSLFAGSAGPCATRDDGDPIVLYDHLADRWLLSQFARTAPIPHQCIAISQTGDPSGSYFVYDFPMPNTKFNDYPKFGVWPDAYYMTDNQFIGSTFAGAGVFAFDRAGMVAGDPTASFIYFDLALLDPSIGGMLPSDLDGPLPPAGAPNPFAYFTADEFGDPQGDALRIFDFHVNFANPGASTFIERIGSPLATDPFDPNLCNFSRNCIPQPGTAVGLDAISDRLMYRLQYRNFGSHESLVVNHTVDADGTDHAGVRYYELRRSTPAGAWSIHEQATFAPDAVHRWMGSAALDHQGNLAVGYSASDNAAFPSIRYAGRLATDSPGGLAQGEAVLKTGAGSQTSALSRWGDYSMLAVDPVDGCTFWYTNNYYASTSSSEWRTHVGSFAFPGCVPLEAQADLSVTKSASADPAPARSTLTYTLVATNLGPLSATGVTLIDTLPVGVSLISVSAGVGSCSAAAGTVTCSLGVLAGGSSVIVTIRVTTPASPGSIVNTATISALQTDPDPTNNSANLITTVLGAELTGAFNPGSLVRRCVRTGLVCTLTGRLMIQNIGFLTARGIQIQFYVSSDGVVSPDDQLVRGVRLAGLARRQVRTIPLRLRTGPSVTGLFLIAVIDPGNLIPELNKTDNVIVLGPLP